MAQVRQALYKVESGTQRQGEPQTDQPMGRARPSVERDAGSSLQAKEVTDLVLSAQREASE